MPENNPGSDLEVEPFQFHEENYIPLRLVIDTFSEHDRQINELREELRLMCIKMEGMQLQIDDLKRLLDEHREYAHA